MQRRHGPGRLPGAGTRGWRCGRGRTARTSRQRTLSSVASDPVARTPAHDHRRRGSGMNAVAHEVRSPLCRWRPMRHGRYRGLTATAWENVPPQNVPAFRRSVIGSAPAFGAGWSWSESRRRNYQISLIYSSPRWLARLAGAWAETRSRYVHPRTTADSRMATRQPGRRNNSSARRDESDTNR